MEEKQEKPHVREIPTKLYHINGTVEETITPMWDDGHDGERLMYALKRFFAPRHYEHVNILHPDKQDEYVDMFVDEVGAITGLPVNEEATRLYQRNSIIHQGAKAEDLPKIYGPAIVILEKVWK